MHHPEGMSLTLRVPGTPISQPRQRTRALGDGRTMNFTPARHQVNVFKASCQHAWAAVYDGPPWEGPVEMRLLCIFPRPKAMNWKKRPTPRARHTKTPDDDNVAKAVRDALNRFAYRDDSQICVMHTEKWIASGDEQPHTIIILTALPYDTANSDSPA